MEKKRVLICGAGSIGVYVGTKLHLRNYDVKLFGRRKLRGIKETIVIDKKNYDVPEKIFELPKNYKADIVFITTKLYDFNNIIEYIKKKRLKCSRVAAIQNGLVDISEHSRIIGKEIVPITVFAGFNLQGNKILVKPTKIGWVTEYSKTGREISRILLDAGIPCKPSKSFNSLRAEKTIVNCCLNGLSAIENKTFLELFRDEKARQRIHNLFEETYNILKNKYKLENPKEMEKKMFLSWSRLDHYSSTCQDIKSGRKNEIPYFNGYIVKLGREHAMPIRYNQAIVNDIRNITR